METPYLDKIIDDLQNHIEAVEAGSYAGIPETRKELAEYEAIKQALSLHNVSQQRELLLAYEKSKCPETWWVSKRQSECEIEDFLANNGG